MNRLLTLNVLKCKKKVKESDEEIDYLERVLSIHVEYEKSEIAHLPNFITSRYRIQKAKLSGKKVLFLYPITELETVEAIKKHMEKIQRQENCPVVLWLERLTYRQKEYLLREHIPFVVEEKQIYLPFMAIYLQERGSAEKIKAQSLLPSAQMLLLYIIYKNGKPFMTSQAAKALDLTSTSIQRAVNQLEELKLVTTRKEGVQKIVWSDMKPKELYEAAKANFQNPVRRVVYIPTDKLSDELLKSGYSALSEYTMLNPPAVMYYATDHIAQWESIATKNLQSAETQSAVELWRYDPKKLSKTKEVDRLSLALSLKDDTDERVEEAVDEMLEQLWREINGSRN